ncbi:MAG: bifunctional folylpolyglutamate synthase/dihydrofolate synthase [Planctomycetes bacterium]|nr:bifunctional folylpolyglutamate synthase/dihydrofolate synthase [Planctomycetota bacterium]
MATRIHNLDDVTAFLAGHTDYEKQLGGRTRDTFDLERMMEMLNLLARPDTAYESAHIAGTKGKGSTAAYLAACLQSQGLVTGLFTSPHLERLTQRIEIGGREITERELVEAFQEVVDAVESLAGGAPDVTFFELLTLTAMVAFRRGGVQVAVFEVGLGGRLDSTNVITPLVSVITEIGMDHMQQLGDTIREIAGEKAGIIKPGVPVVCGAQDPEAQRVIRQTARDQEAPVLEYGREYSVRGVNRVNGHIEFTADITGQRYEKVRLLHPARFMVDNAAHALCALEVIATAVPDLLPDGALHRELAMDALSRVSLPGKFEIFRGQPVIVIDSAHNELSLKAAMATARVVSRGKVVCVAGLAKDKDLEACIRRVAEGADAAVFTTYYSTRQNRPEDLLRTYTKFGGKAGSMEEHPEAALETAIELAGEDGLVLVTGSTYLAGALRQAALEYAQQ